MKAKEEVESFSFRKKKPAEEEGEELITEPRCFWGLSKSRESGIVYRERHRFIGAGNNAESTI